jgi:hypothetical protein
MGRQQAQYTTHKVKEQIHMAFAISFLPTPAYFDAFKMFLQTQYMGKESAVIVQHLDLVDYVRHQMNAAEFSPEDEEIWTRNAMGFPGWGQAYDSVEAMFQVIETWMDEQGA